MFTDNHLEVASYACGSANISASSCVMGICHLSFDISSSSCHNSMSDVINVNVFASNVLGSGHPYNTTVGILHIIAKSIILFNNIIIDNILKMFVHADVNNVILEVKFNTEFTQVTCRSLPWIYIENNRINCSFVYSTLDSNSQMFFITDTSKTDTVILNLSTAANSIFPNVKYRFSMSATYDNSTAVVEGSFTKNEGKLCETQCQCLIYINMILIYAHMHVYTENSIKSFHSRCTCLWSSCRSNGGSDNNHYHNCHYHLNYGICLWQTKRIKHFNKFY